MAMFQVSSCARAWGASAGKTSNGLYKPSRRIVAAGFWRAQLVDDLFEVAAGPCDGLRGRRLPAVNRRCRLLRAQAVAEIVAAGRDRIRLAACSCLPASAPDELQHLAGLVPGDRQVGESDAAPGRRGAGAPAPGPRSPRAIARALGQSNPRARRCAWRPGAPRWPCPRANGAMAVPKPEVRAKHEAR